MPDTLHPASQGLCAIDWRTLGRHMGLSAQQVEILQLIVDQDLTAPRLARTLHVKPSCINEQLDRMRKKLSVQSRAALIAKAWRAWMEMEKASAGC